MVEFESVRPTSSRSSTRASVDKLKSTLDIVYDKEITAHIAQEIVETGDIVLYGNTMEHKSSNWYKVIVAGGGKASMERRLPIIHAAIIIKNPPDDILRTFSLLREDGKAFVFEATGSSPKGARMLPLKDWTAFELNPSYPGGKVLLRRRETTEPFTPPPELWEWLKEARTIPYSAVNSETVFNSFFLEGSYSALVKAGADIIMDAIQDKTGDGALSRTAQGLVGLLSQVLIFFLLVVNFLWVFLTSWVPYVVRRGKIKNEDGLHYVKKFGGSENDVPHMFCSKAAAETLMHAGILSRKTPSNWYLPKDFLPKDIGAKGNLFDDRLNDGFHYSDKLIFIKRPEEGDSTARMSRFQSFFHNVGVRAAHYQDEEGILNVAKQTTAEEKED